MNADTDICFDVVVKPGTTKTVCDDNDHGMQLIMSD